MTSTSDLDLRIEDRLPPQNIDAEENILGGILMDREAITRVIEHLKADAFYVASHQEIYRAALTLHAHGRPTDLLSMVAWLEDNKLIERVGGRSYLRRLTDAAINTINIDQYARLVMDKYAMRMLIRAGQEVTALGYETTIEIPKLLDMAEQTMFAVTQERVQRSLVPASEVLMTIFEQLESRYQDGSNIFGIPTDFYDLDNYTQGLQPSDLIIVAGRPGMGKCCAWNTPIVDPTTGALLAIEEVFRRGQAGKPVEVLSLLADGYLARVSASHFVDDGIKPVYRVRTRLGREVETTLSHPYLTPQGWKPLEALTVGTRIAVPRRLDVFGHEFVSEPEIILLADQVGSGCTVDVPTPEKCIPTAVFKLPKAQLSLFLNQLFSTEARTDPGAHNPISFSSVSKKLCQQVQHLLLRFGVLASLQEERVLSQGSERSNYLVEISADESIQAFAREIGVFAEGAQSFVLPPQQKATSTDIYWDEIVAIEYVGMEQVYDLTVPVTHNFVAADVCLHNTAFALTIAQKIAQKAGLPSVVFSLEMSKEQLVQRLLCAEAGVESHRLRSARISEHEWQRIGQAIGELAMIPLYIDDSPNATVTEIRSKARRLQAEQGGKLGLVMIDYLQLMEGAGSDNRVQELSKITRGLKGLARELRVPVMALSQLSRGVEARTNKRPMLSDLRESGCLTGDTTILRADNGQAVTLQALYASAERNIPIWTLNADLKLVRATMTHVFSSGIKQTYRLVLRSGKQIKASANHPFLTEDGWRHLEELWIGSRIATAKLDGDSPAPRMAERSERAVSVLNRETLTYQSQSDILWDEVAAIQVLDAVEVFDATVPGTHNFLANGIIVHNSIEQDADLVLMLYRDDYYNPDSPDRNVAEVNIVKHRNGPTGTVKLLFESQFTKFLNLTSGNR